MATDEQLAYWAAKAAQLDADAPLDALKMFEALMLEMFPDSAPNLTRGQRWVVAEEYIRRVLENGD